MSNENTLGYYRDMASMLLGEDSPAVSYMDEQINREAKGREAEADPAKNQVISVLIAAHKRDKALAKP